jgi:hypothetical protein
VFWASLDFMALSAVPYGSGLDLGGTVVCLCLVNHPKSECFWVARAFSAYVGSLGSGENMAFPEGNPCVFTVGPGQEMKDKVIMTVEKVGSEETSRRWPSNVKYPDKKNGFGSSDPVLYDPYLDPRFTHKIRCFIMFYPTCCYLY